MDRVATTLPLAAIPLLQYPPHTMTLSISYAFFFKKNLGILFKMGGGRNKGSLYFTLLDPPISQRCRFHLIKLPNRKGFRKPSDETCLLFRCSEMFVHAKVAFFKQIENAQTLFCSSKLFVTLWLGKEK